MEKNVTSHCEVNFASCRTCQRRERYVFKASQSAIGGCWWALRLRAHRRPAAAVVTHLPSSISLEKKSHTSTVMT